VDYVLVMVELFEIVKLGTSLHFIVDIFSNKTYSLL